MSNKKINPTTPKAIGKPIVGKDSAGVVWRITELEGDTLKLERWPLTLVCVSRYDQTESTTVKHWGVLIENKSLHTHLLARVVSSPCVWPGNN